MALRNKVGRFRCAELLTVDSLLKRARDWDAEVAKLLGAPGAKPPSQPSLRSVRRLVERGRRSQMKLRRLPELEVVAASGENWLRRAASVFLRKGSKVSLSSALARVNAPLNTKKWAQLRARNEKRADNEDASFCTCKRPASGFVSDWRIILRPVCNNA